MARTGDPAARAAVAVLPRARPLLWWLALVLFVAVGVALIGVPYLLVAARPRPAVPTAVSTTITWVVLQPALLVLTSLLAMYSFGRARLEGSASRGLHVDVAEFAEGRTEAPTPSARELTAKFSRRLTESRIYSPAALPGAAGSYDFLQVVENAGEAASTGWWRVAARALRLLLPPGAYRVTGTVVAAERPRLVVELIRLPRFAATPLVIEDDSWDRVLERAANSVAAQIFPRSKICRQRPQWADWWGYAFPTELFDAYQRAHQFQAARRFDQALAEFYRALRHDPANVYIRLEIAQLQERLNMHLDALVTYDDVITICSRGDEGLASWWDGDEQSPTQGHRAVALLVARYRHALMLGHGDRIAEQWWLRGGGCDHDQHWDARQRHRRYLRRLAGRRLERYERAAAGILADQRPDAYEQALDIDWPSRTPLEERRRHAKVLRLYLCTLGQYEFERLIADYPRLSGRLRRLAMRNPVELITLRGLRTSLIWTVLRRALAQAELGLRVGYHPVWRRARAPRWLTALLDQWPVSEARLRESISAVIPRLGRANWQEHYNVACFCAVALLSPGNEAETELRKLAISHLYRAAAGSHSGYLAERRPWLLYEDRDLQSLRGTPEFRNFEMITFSPAREVPLRPRQTHVWELVCYQTLLVSGIARRMRATWFARGLDGVAPDARPGPTPWYALEVEAWRQIMRLAVSHRDWRTRRDAALFLPDELGLPTFTQERLYTRYVNVFGEERLRVRRADMPDRIRMVNEIADEYIDHCDGRMTDLARHIHRLDRRGADPCDNAHGAVGGMRITGSPLLSGLEHEIRSPRGVRKLCADRAELWGTLADLFDDDLEGAPAADRMRAFRAALRRPGILARLSS
ncbi:hypothetical protein [Actinophytocola sp.]|uniref:hypothetical protein n=1 Tax=Actinophytocola sp. TaxID=1872138 RepID=UPI00389ACBA3